ncbi:hypothetical protein FOTG_18758 [Fusarium oxysporum f. sp. vasinfectum 25433]|uniref:Uncharacterized protein n=1 Tax=Fusarium oxysporum f. sp. vasinfectum 25433 TaxID=1089449 RepID=X0KGY5_FUSOX|nr:hypothetical protein FOTG_18758 [Fusarium oxysporum f. sp. vasinfectum 25433]
MGSLSRGDSAYFRGSRAQRQPSAPFKWCACRHSGPTLCCHRRRRCFRYWWPEYSGRQLACQV